jgi:type I restriction enzyme, S subunit
VTWTTTKIGELASVVTKGTTPTTYGMPFTDSGVNFIKAEALNGDSTLDKSGFTFIAESTHEKLKRSILADSDVLVTIAGAQVGRCGLVRTEHLPANTNQAVGIIRVDPRRAEPAFVYYYFKSPKTFQICQGLGGQAAQPNINLEMLKSFELSLPERKTQKAIVEILSAYDDLIENNRRRIRLLEEAARLLYREWFVYFRFPGHEHVKITNGLPEGWQQKTFDDVCDAVGGGTPSTAKSEYWNDGDIPWYTPTDITRNTCLALLDSGTKITEAGLRSSSAKMLPAGTVLMTSRASVGFFGIIDAPSCTNQGFISIIPADSRSRMYLLYNLMYRVEEIRSHAGGSTYKEISRGKFRALPVVMPAQRLLHEFENHASGLHQQVRGLHQMNRKLAEARDLLLPRLMSGEIAV